MREKSLEHVWVPKDGREGAQTERQERKKAEKVWSRRELSWAEIGLVPYGFLFDK